MDWVWPYERCGTGPEQSGLGRGEERKGVGRGWGDEFHVPR